MPDSQYKENQYRSESQKECSPKMCVCVCVCVHTHVAHVYYMAWVEVLLDMG
jgi:L-asparaginase II